jgi:hypothetical protein
MAKNEIDQIVKSVAQTHQRSQEKRYQETG